MTVSPVTLVTSLVVGLTLMGVASTVILRVQAQHDRLRLRMVRALAPHQKHGSGSASPAGSGVGLTTATVGLGSMLARLFGFDPGLAEHYLLRWWMALICTLAASVVTAKISVGLLGPIVWLAMPMEWIMLSCSSSAGPKGGGATSCLSNFPTRWQ